MWLFEISRRGLFQRQPIVRRCFAFRTAWLMGHNERFSSGFKKMHNQRTVATRQHGNRASAVDAFNTRPSKARDIREDGFVRHVNYSRRCYGCSEYEQVAK
jgi:hypothetical protein